MSPLRQRKSTCMPTCVSKRRLSPVWHPPRRDQGGIGQTMLCSASLKRSDYAAWQRRSGRVLRANPDRRGITLGSALWPLCRYRHNTHWTGHASRLARDLAHRFGSEGYAREELVAEIASAFLCASLAIQPTVRHAD